MGETVRQIQQVFFLLTGLFESFIDRFVENDMAGGASQTRFACAFQLNVVVVGNLEECFSFASKYLNCGISVLGRFSLLLREEHLDGVLFRRGFTSMHMEECGPLVYDSVAEWLGLEDDAPELAEFLECFHYGLWSYKKYSKL